MADNFKVIYKILTILESNLDRAVFDEEELSPRRLGVSEVRRNKYLEMMCGAQLIDGVDFKTYADGETYADISGIKITLKGLEYLSENSIMQRMYKAAKGIKDIIK